MTAVSVSLLEIDEEQYTINASATDHGFCDANGDYVSYVTVFSTGYAVEKVNEATEKLEQLLTEGGTIDAIDAMLDCAGDVDFVLAKICTNDINSNNATAEELFPVWTNLVWKTLNRKPHAKFIAGAVVDIARILTEGMFVGLMSAVKIGGVQLHNIWWVYFAITLPAILTCGLSYFLGHKNFRFTSWFNYKDPNKK